MMTTCCNFESCSNDIRNVLWIALAINIVVFCGQFIFAVLANSSSLLADSIDMIGDVIAYSMSLYAIKQGGNWVTKAALFKGIIITLLSLMVLLDASKKIVFIEPIPSYDYMVIFSVLGLLTNGICLWLLTSYRDINLNMQSVWVCSRNDILVNLSVIFTALLVCHYKNQWPDIIVGICLGFFLFYSGVRIIQLALKLRSSLISVQVAIQ